MSIHDDLLLVSVLEGLSSGHAAAFSGDYFDALTQSEEISSQYVHVNGLSDVVGVMSSDDLVCTNLGGTSVKGLSSEYTAEGAVVGQSYYFDNLIHSPSIKIFV